MKIYLSLLFLLVFFPTVVTIADGQIQIEQTLDDSIGPITDNSSENSSLTNDDQCNEYQIGEERHLRGMYDSYSVKKESDQHYKASVVLKFGVTGNYYDKNKEGLGIAEFERYVHTHQIQRVRECIQSVTSKMLGPNGEILEIVIRDGYEETNVNIGIHTITIDDIEVIFNSYRQYAPNIDCSIMTHEILHLFSLNDEYTRDWGVLLTPMIGKVRKISFISLPFIKFRLSLQYYSIMSYGIKRWNDVFNSSETSFLDPTHFNAILYGNCRDRSDVKLYRDCYGSVDSRPTLSIDECQRQDILGRGKQRELQIIENEFSTNNSFWFFFEYFKENLRVPTEIDEQVYDQYIEKLRERKRIVQNWPD